MTTTVVSTPIERSGEFALTAYETLASLGAMTWTRFQNTSVIAQLSGTATAVTAIVERSAVDPAGTAVAAPASATAMSGDLTSGVAPNIYTESGVGWWRIRVTVLTGGSVTASLTGKGA